MLNLCLVCPKTKSGILPYFDIKNQVLALFDSASMTSKNYASHSIIIRRNVHWAQLQQMVMSVPEPSIVALFFWRAKGMSTFGVLWRFWMKRALFNVFDEANMFSRCRTPKSSWAKGGSPQNARKLPQNERNLKSGGTTLTWVGYERDPCACFECL